MLWYDSDCCGTIQIHFSLDSVVDVAQAVQQDCQSKDACMQSWLMMFQLSESSTGPVVTDACLTDSTTLCRNMHVHHHKA
jgi:hypothetical protein